MADPAFHLDVLTPEGVVRSLEVTHVVAPGRDGYLGILANHAPLATIIDIGVINYTPAGSSQEEVLAVANGILEVCDNRVSILANSCESWDEIDLERARDALKRAEERLAIIREDVNIDRAQNALKRALTRVRVKEKKFTF